VPQPTAPPRAPLGSQVQKNNVFPRNSSENVNYSSVLSLISKAIPLNNVLSIVLSSTAPITTGRMYRFRKLQGVFSRAPTATKNSTRTLLPYVKSQSELENKFQLDISRRKQKITHAGDKSHEHVVARLPSRWQEKTVNGHGDNMST
jgi:hypothetical protein